MSGKRKRDDLTTSGATSKAKPLSAIAAARLRAESAAKDITAPEIVHEPVSVPLHQPIPVSESEDDEAESEEQSLPVRRSSRLCNWRHELSDILSDTETELTINLKKHATIALIGCFDLKVLRGAVHINGANIGTVSHGGQKHKTYRIHVPATHPILKIRGLDSVNHVHFINCKQPTPLAGSSPMFADIWNAKPIGRPHRSFSIITESSSDPFSRPLNPEVAPEDWLRAVEDCTSTPSITLVAGPSGSGKSVFAKRLVNRYLTGLGKTAPSAAAACLLDLNPYKQEYAPAGQISLVLVRDVNLGPSFTHPAVLQQQGNSSGDELVRAHPIPADLANYMKYFESCIEDLFLTFKNLQARDKSLPLIIDTSGLLYTVAFDILTKLLTQAKAHHIVHFGDVCALDTDGATRLHTLQTVAAQFRGTVHDITAQYPVSTPMRDESELRTMQLQSYFHLKFGSTIPGASQRFDWTQKSLSHAIPWEFSYQDTPERTQDFVGFAMYTEPIEPASLPHALVGSIVQIIQSTSSVIPSPYTTLPRTSRYKLPYLPRDEGLGMVAPLDPRTSSFICTAIIREFDPGRKVVRLLLPSTCDSLLRSLSAERTVLVGGCCDMPEWFLLEDAYMRDEGLAGDDSSPNGTPGHESHWVEKRSEAKSIGYLDTVRRVRKFQS